MKRLTTILATLIVIVSGFAQAPEKMSYQAVIRDGSDMLVTYTNIGMQISILQGSANGTAVYVERHFPSTDANGLVTLEIGTGTIISGDFSAIDWMDSPYFIKTETDLNGGSNYTITGTSQLMSVPYALHAKTAESVESVDYTNGISLPYSFGPDTNFVGSQGNSISFGHEEVSEDFIGYSDNRFYFKDSPGGGDEIDPYIIIGGRVGIGTGNPSTSLHVEGEVRIADGTEGENKVLVSDGDGNASWEGATGVEYSYTDNYVNWPDGDYEAKPLDSLTMSIPQSGYVMLTHSGYAVFFSQNRTMHAGIGTEPTTILRSVTFGYLDGSSTLRYEVPYSITYVVEVTEGTHVFYAIAEGVSVFKTGSVNVSPQSFVGLFIPNKY